MCITYNCDRINHARIVSYYLTACVRGYHIPLLPPVAKNDTDLVFISLSMGLFRTGS